MSESRLNTALVGFGKIAQGYDDDKRMATKLRYMTHLSVLRDHPRFKLVSVAEPLETARQKARTLVSIDDIAADAAELKNADNIEVAVLAIPPGSRVDVMRAFPNLKAVIVEKPIGTTAEEAAEFEHECRSRSLVAQVNIIRRGDEFTRSLAAGELNELVGAIQSVFGIYGNGAHNNGTHMVDLVRMLIGEVDAVHAFGETEFSEGPLVGDSNFSFALSLANGKLAQFSPVRFAEYRENGLDIWGTRGRLSYLSGGLTLLHSAVIPHRTQEKEFEVAADLTRILQPTLGTALYNLYTNLAAGIDGDELLSPVSNAVQTARVIDALFESKKARSTVRVSTETVRSQLGTAPNKLG